MKSSHLPRVRHVQLQKQGYEMPGQDVMLRSPSLDTFPSALSVTRHLKPCHHEADLGLSVQGLYRGLILYLAD
jgi:hypothetical protein